MTGTNVIKRTAAAPGANTDTTIITPAIGQKIKILAFWIANEVAAQAAGMTFELRFGAQILGVVGYNSAAAPIGQTSNICVCNHELIGDGSTVLALRNLVALAATSTACITLVVEVG